MKTLYLVRHAKSSWKDHNLSDDERPLNKRGKRDAPFMGNLLKKKGIKPDFIISSPAVRAHKTSAIIAKEIGVPVEDISTSDQIYENDATELIELINNFPDEKNSAMLFGHNPSLTSLSNYLTNEYIDNIPTCAIAAIDFDVESWKDIKADSGKIIFYEFPKKYLK